VPFAPCYMATVQRYPKAGTVVITIKDHRPQDAPRLVSGGLGSPSGSTT
jgi:hypothetical protein